jgi:hypothetical protein
MIRERQAKSENNYVGNVSLDGLEGLQPTSISERAHVSQAIQGCGGVSAPRLALGLVPNRIPIEPRQPRARGCVSFHHALDHKLTRGAIGLSVVAVEK